MASIERRLSHGRPVFYVKIRMQRHAKSATFHSLSEARQWAKVTEAAILEARYLPQKQTLCQVIDRYRVDVLPHKAPLTIASQNTHLTYWNQRLGHRAVADIGASLIAEERAKLARKVTPGTVNRYLAALSHVLSTAAE